MIAYLQGILAEKTESYVIIDTGGVGYQVGISSQTLSDLPKTGERVKVFIYHHFTDSEQRLFGFLTMDEKALFEKLITVKGVGPKLALGILSGMPHGDLIEVISRHDAIRLSGIPGIGKKTAERIVLELGDKLAKIAGSGTSESQPSGSAATETISALESLGYRKMEAQKAVQQALKENRDADLSELLKNALRVLAK